MNVNAYINRQKAEDRRAFIIHYPAASGKTAFARRIRATREDAELFDLQAYWLEHPELLPGKFDFSELRKLLLGLEVTHPVILVDNLDILINTWRAKDRKDFINWLKIQLRSPRDTNKTFVFMLQDDRFLDKADLTNAHGESRVLPLDAFEAL
jgi:hypothetical protein